MNITNAKFKKNSRSRFFKPQPARASLNKFEYNFFMFSQKTRSGDRQTPIQFQFQFQFIFIFIDSPNMLSYNHVCISVIGEGMEIILRTLAISLHYLMLYSMFCANGRDES